MKRLTVLAMLGLAGCSVIPGTEPYKEKLARQLLVHALSDPNSAEFNNLTGPIGWYIFDGNHREMCGEVNAKNAVGAYTGFKRFSGALDGLVTIEPEANDVLYDFDRKQFDRGWSICHPKG